MNTLFESPDLPKEITPPPPDPPLGFIKDLVYEWFNWRHRPKQNLKPWSNQDLSWVVKFASGRNTLIFYAFTFSHAEKYHANILIPFILSAQQCWLMCVLWFSTYLSGTGSALLTFSSRSAIRSNFHWRRLETTCQPRKAHFSIVDGIANLYCQTPRQKVEMGAITNIAPATLESIQLSLATALGTWQGHEKSIDQFFCMIWGVFKIWIIPAWCVYELVVSPGDWQVVVLTSPTLFRGISASVQDYCAIFVQ